MLFGATNRIIHRFDVEDNEAVGWDEAGEELARVPYREPDAVRPYHDEQIGVYRHNTT